LAQRLSVSDVDCLGEAFDVGERRAEPAGGGGDAGFDFVHRHQVTDDAGEAGEELVGGSSIWAAARAHIARASRSPRLPVQALAHCRRVTTTPPQPAPRLRQVVAARRS
jgi:hypothetical protein